MPAPFGLRLGTADHAAGPKQWTAGIQGGSPRREVGTVVMAVPCSGLFYRVCQSLVLCRRRGSRNAVLAIFVARVPTARRKESSGLRK